MKRDEFLPGEPAPACGVFECLNVFGTPTGEVIVVNDGEMLPAAPRGFRWRPLRELSVADLRARAAEYRRMAATATTPGVMLSLNKLAASFDDLAGQQSG